MSVAAGTGAWDRQSIAPRFGAKRADQDRALIRTQDREDLGEGLPG
jgi:hypothetical protein